MTDEDEWARHRTEFYALSPEARRLWLARLMFVVTMHGRDCYEAGTTAVSDPERLRRLNELMHRIADHNVAVVSDDVHGRPDEVFLQILFEELRSLGINADYFDPMMNRRP